MITILTPTYNRAYILPDAFKSLCMQSSYDFEWIIIDDGSTDNTAEVVAKWQNEDLPFKLTYCKQENGGKHRAVNAGVKIAKYDFLLILDSDDRLTETAVSTINHWVEEIKEDYSFAGVAGLKGTGKQVIGSQIEQEYIDATNLERGKYGLYGDKAEIYRTAILRQYPFPEFEGENFIRESAVWDRIAKDGYKIRWYNKVIYLCEYIEDGLTKNTTSSTYLKNFNGFTYCSKLYIETHSWLPSMHKCGEYYSVAKHKKFNIKSASKSINVNPLFFMLGIILFNLKLCIRRIVNKIDRRK